jgi:hypothetical protein
MTPLISTIHSTKEVANMSIPNRISLDALRTTPIGKIVALPAGQLALLQQETEEALRNAKATVAWLDGALLMKYADRAEATRRDAEKDFGTTRFMDGDVTVVADLPKKVDWDQAKLHRLIERIKADGDDPREYVDIILKVSERKYTAWPSHIAAAFATARTVKAGAPSFKLIVNREGVQ